MNATTKLGYEFDEYKESFGFGSAPAPRTISNPITDDSDAPSVRIVAGWFSNFHNGLRTAENGYERGLFKRA
ncbi:hypothetical protein [Celeribacter halophilus]|uniref:Uncharacterized protein n=1 Tax=Celeribacter halophilus TaxID=576117 RepID=A0A1I3X3E9_9RHOB|nr:hypothetical protein [Celeribacter halophilus]PZX04692.1 hypothetical protein LX82_03658 [Celeribacter halophilus]SFK14123.1 hypothetical protein SAMN04488138_13813 [Celeribacter halophilus]